MSFDRSRRPAPRTCALLVGLLAAALPTARAAAQPAAPAVDAEERGRQHAALHVRYAEARVRLAEADLEKARELNRLNPNTVPAGELATLEDRIAVLRLLARDARDKPHGNGLEIQRASARAAAARAQGALESARAARKIADNALTDIDLKRLELKVEVTRLRADLWDDPVMVPSLIDEMQVQIEQLQEQVQELAHDIDVVRARGVNRP